MGNVGGGGSVSILAIKLMFYLNCKSERLVGMQREDQYCSLIGSTCLLIGQQNSPFPVNETVSVVIVPYFHLIYYRIVKRCRRIQV